MPKSPAHPALKVLLPKVDFRVEAVSLAEAFRAGAVFKAVEDSPVAAVSKVEAEAFREAAETMGVAAEALELSNPIARHCQPKTTC
jgi:hypothetical protein